MEKVRTRFAPSPTGYMHIGNLRTALYAFLMAKHYNGDFILRIEDTDQKRYVDGALDVIYNTLKLTHLNYDEGPNTNGEYGPYFQSERKDIYKKYALWLVEHDYAYYCFCKDSHEENDDQSDEKTYGYNRHCRNLSEEEITEKLKNGCSYVIRQKIPLTGQTTFHDELYGTITVKNETLDDQILLKSDGMPTYNFANVVDDHLMNITHVMRGKEYIVSTPKYQLLYENFGWTPPKNIHLSTILGQNADGTVSKLSKRHGAVSFEKLLEIGYLEEAILNYILLLGWNPKSEQEIFSLDEMIEAFNVDGLCKSDAVFDYKKLDWINAHYIKNLSPDEFLRRTEPYLSTLPTFVKEKWNFASNLAQGRISKLSDIVNLFAFLNEYSEFDLSLFENKKNKLEKTDSLKILKEIKSQFEKVDDWTNESLNNVLNEYATEHEMKIGRPMWAVRIAVSGNPVTPGGASEMMYLLGKETCLNRISQSISRLEKN